jgi:HlyD family secretion protein
MNVLPCIPWFVLSHRCWAASLISSRKIPFASLRGCDSLRAICRAERGATPTTMKWIILILILAAAGAGGWWWWSQSAAKDKTTTYETTEVARGPITAVVSATGTLNPTITVQVGSQVSGIIQALYADYNTMVTSNQVVAIIEQQPFKIKVQQNEAALAKARATAALAKATLDRQKQLIVGHLVSQADLDAAQAQYDQASADVVSAQASLESAKVDLAHTTIYSPVNGMVLTRSVDIGQTVAASLSAPTLFTIAKDPRQMQIDANVDEADVGQVEMGHPVNFSVDAYPDLTFQGKVTQVRNAPIIVQNVTTYDTIISVDNSDMKLKPGMTANVTILVDTHPSALRVPNKALRFKLPEDNGKKKKSEPHWTWSDLRGKSPEKKKSAVQKPPGQQVYVLRDDKPVAAAIRTGLNDGQFTEILEGLKEGDKVITSIAAPKTANTQSLTNPFAPPKPPAGSRRQ